MKRVIASAPGKLHLMGEHAVVYGRPALLSSVNLRCTAIIQEKEGDTIEIVSKNFNARKTVSVNDVETITKDAHAKWKEYTENLDLTTLLSITKDLTSYPIIVIGETFQYFQKEVTGGFQLIVDSEIPIQSGFGSSAAAAVSIVAALISYLGEKYDKAVINEIALRAEHKLHGFPSGGDIAASVYGGLIWFKKEHDKKTIEPVRFKISPHMRERFLIIDSGKPLESTGEMVSVVRAFYNSNKEEFEEFLNSQSELTFELTQALEQDNEDEMMSIIKQGEKNLESIGIVSDETKHIIRSIEENGGVAKMCGAGGKKKGTGMLLSYHKDSHALQDVLMQQNVPFFTVELGVKGVTITS